ncbi:MAG: GNAT family N-acetyltransferase [Nakamurella sp.]
MAIRYTDRLRLEPIGPEHADDLLRLFTDPTVARWWGEWTAEMAQREAERFGRGWATDGVHKWMAYHRMTGELVGRGGLSRAHIDGRDRVEIGWVLRQEFLGHGYATEIGRAGLDFAFNELDVDEVVSFTEARNIKSRAVMQRLGFHYVKDFTIESDGEPFALYLLERKRHVVSAPGSVIPPDTSGTRTGSA